MKLSKVIALGAAGVVGASGGVVFAMTGQGAPQDGAVSNPAPTSVSRAASTAPSTTGGADSAGSPTPSEPSRDAFLAKNNTPLLYATEKTIRDGESRIELNDVGDVSVSTVDRLADGYLVGVTQSDGGDHHLLILDSAGNVEDLGETTNNYDINLAKDRIVSVDSSTNRAVVWSSEGKVIGRTDSSDGNLELSQVGFVDDQVSIISTNFEGPSLAIRWDPETSKINKIEPPGLLSIGLSPDGTVLAGNDPEGCLTVTNNDPANTNAWLECDWSSTAGQAQFSPNGELVLAAPELTDGFGPLRLAAFGVRAGPAKPVGKFAVPELTTDAQWADDTHLWLSGARGGDTEFGKGAWIKKCNLDGECETVVKTDKGRVVLGGGVY